MGEHLGVAPGAETVASSRQLVAEGTEVVDLPVEGDSETTVLIGDRWVARFQVDDREPGLADAPRPGREDATGVRAPVEEEVELRLDLPPVPVVLADGPGYAAHGRSIAGEVYPDADSTDFNLPLRSEEVQVS